MGTLFGEKRLGVYIDFSTTLGNRDIYFQTKLRILGAAGVVVVTAGIVQLFAALGESLTATKRQKSHCRNISTFINVDHDDYELEHVPG